MHKIVSVLLLLFFIAQPQLHAQVTPKEGSVLNYRRIGFAFPAMDNVIKYRIELAAGTYTDGAAFKKNIFRSADATTNVAIADVPQFKTDYTWRVVYTRKKGAGSASALYHFSTGYVTAIDSAFVRLRILKPADAYKDDLVFADGSNVLYDMKGNPMWYLPVPANNPRQNTQVRDLKLTPQGTITYLIDQHAYEINYNGDTLWKGPDNGAVSGEDSERYHHELTRLTNGHYMVLGTERVLWNRNETRADTSNIMNPGKKTPFGTIIEYNGQGNVVWSWRSSPYFMSSDVVNYHPDGAAQGIDVHENAFYFDEENKVIYISFRNISRILKIKYPEGNVLASYGEVFNPDMHITGNGLFCEQHGIRRTKGGQLLLYNNNSCHDDKTMPTVLVMQEPDTKNGQLSKTWEYTCDADGVSINQAMAKTFENRQSLVRQRATPNPLKAPQLKVSIGGNVTELPGHELFVCMNTQYSKMFIVNRDKQIVWSAVTEKRDPIQAKWFASQDQYRAYIITPAALDSLIRNSVTK